MITNWSFTHMNEIQPMLLKPFFAMTKRIHSAKKMTNAYKCILM